MLTDEEFDQLTKFSNFDEIKSHCVEIIPKQFYWFSHKAYLTENSV